MTDTAHAIAAAISAGTVSARDIITGTLAAIEQVNGRLNAFTDLLPARALAAADQIDRLRAAGGTLPPLAGVPFAVKNLYDIEGLPTRAGARINRDDPPAEADAVLVRRLTAAGAIPVGTTNMTEYAYGFTGENPHDGPALTPHDTGRLAGGSSGGSAAAVAAGLVPVALGSDTNGSIRVPAAFCGVFGLKPTYGRLTRAGTYPFVNSLDHLGPLARSVADLAVCYDLLQGSDPTAAHIHRRGIEPTVTSLDAGTRDLRIAVLGGYFRGQGDAASDIAVDHVARALDAGETVDLPGSAEARAAAFLITASESASLHLHHVRTRGDDLDPDTRDRFLAGATMPAHWLVQAHKIRSWYRDRVRALFARCDLLLAATTPAPAPALGQQTLTLNGVEMPLRPHIGVYTQPISFAGLPVVNVPVWLERHALPYGVQLIAAPWREDVALRAARTLERSGIVSVQPPPRLS